MEPASRYQDPASRLITMEPDPKDGYGLSPGGIWVPDRNHKHGKPTAVDLFCGTGGFSLGFIQAGFEVVCGIEHDVWAAVSYLMNLGQWPMQIHFVTPEDEERFERTLKRAQKKHVKAAEEAGKTVTRTVFATAGEHRPAGQTPVRSFIFGDICKVSGEQIRQVTGIEKIDAVIGGPPCQGFSTANTRSGPDDPRNRLVFEFARLIVELNPNSFVMENVPEIATMRTPDGIKVLDQFEAILRRGGYDTYDALEKLREARPKTTAVHRRADPNDVERTVTEKKTPKKTPAATPLFDISGA